MIFQLPKEEIGKMPTPLTPIEEAIETRKAAAQAMREVNAEMREKYPNSEFVKIYCNDDPINEREKLYDEGILKDEIEIEEPETWEEFLELERKFDAKPPADPITLYL